MEVEKKSREENANTATESPCGKRGQRERERERVREKDMVVE